MIKKRGRMYVVTTHDGKKTLGEHTTLSQAKKQLAAIEASKAGKGKK